MKKDYFTVQGFSKNEYEINKSLFISYVARTETEEEAQEFISKIKKKHYDATHNCSAYVLGQNQETQKANDDGEPSGTAGRPILELIKKNQLTDTSIVVTRYFGGIKLGAGGLIRAYGKSASLGLETNQKIKKELHTLLSLTIEYPLLGSVENELRNKNYLIKNIEYLDKVTIFVYVKKGQEEEFLQEITNLTAGEVKYKEEAEEYLEKIVQKGEE